MKLINHNKNNAYVINTYVMHGTIEMTIKEYTEAIIFIADEYQKAVKNIYTVIRDGLDHALLTHRNIFLKTNARYLSLGVTATKLIAKKYHLKGYKDQNYGIKII